MKNLWVGSFAAHPVKRQVNPSSASADVALDAGADEPAEALCEGGSCHGNHGFTRGAPFLL
jgi:hypothetical protein